MATVSNLSRAKGAIPTPEGEFEGQDHGAALVTLRHDLLEKVGLLAAAHLRVSGSEGDAVTGL